MKQRHEFGGRKGRNLVGKQMRLPFSLVILASFVTILVYLWQIRQMVSYQTNFKCSDKYRFIEKQSVQQNRDSTWPPRDLVDRIKDSKGRVIVSAVNCGYVDFADNFVAALERLNVTNYVLVPLDQNAYTLFAPVVS